ncbi:MAG TPA: oxygenase MpaB family protein [Vicinamibacterales bacterium]|nr:oxygenase MpaB family protein [Vicinamibacterales bacterium]
MNPVADRVNGERLVLLGWPRAILLQVAHPLIAAGVCDHSTFRDDAVAPVRRLHSTVKAMLGLTFGDTGERHRVIAGIRAIHRRVNGTLRHTVGPYTAGTPYSAEDPALVLWVHATLIDTTLTLYERVAGALTAAERDEYCRDSAAVAVALGARPEAVPRNWAVMRNYVDGVIGSGNLAVGPDARALAQALLAGPAVRLSGPLAWATRQVTVGLMPPDLRRQYGLRWTGRNEGRLDRLLRGLATVRQLTPDRLARWSAARSSARHG